MFVNTYYNTMRFFDKFSAKKIMSGHIFSRIEYFPNTFDSFGFPEQNEYVVFLDYEIRSGIYLSFTVTDGGNDADACFTA